MESWVVWCLGFDHSVLAKITTYWFYSSFFMMECGQILTSKTNNFPYRQKLNDQNLEEV